MAPPPVRQLRQVIDAVAAAMDADNMGVTHLVGSGAPDDRRGDGIPLRHRIPTSDKYEAPYLGGQYGYEAGPSNPRALFSRLMGVEVHCWGIVQPPDDASDPDVYFPTPASLLAQNLIVYLRRVAAADFIVNGGVWLDSKDRTTWQVRPASTCSGSASTRRRRTRRTRSPRFSRS